MKTRKPIAFALLGEKGCETNPLRIAEVSEVHGSSRIPNGWYAITHTHIDEDLSISSFMAPEIVDGYWQNLTGEQLDRVHPLELPCAIAQTLLGVTAVVCAAIYLPLRMFRRMFC